MYAARQGRGIAPDLGAIAVEDPILPLKRLDATVYEAGSCGAGDAKEIPHVRVSRDHAQVWQAYLDVLRQDGLDAAGTHQFYLDRSDVIPKFPPGPRWGCFSYDYYDTMRAVHLHFGNLDEPEPGALSAARKDARLGELWAMFAAIRRDHPDVETVRGHSWLYNREGYRRLFPASYLASATAARPNLQARSVWGSSCRAIGR